jgi:hypothetical protein
MRINELHIIVEQLPSARLVNVIPVKPPAVTPVSKQENTVKPPAATSVSRQENTVELSISKPVKTKSNDLEVEIKYYNPRLIRDLTNEKKSAPDFTGSAEEIQLQRLKFEIEQETELHRKIESYIINEEDEKKFIESTKKINLRNNELHARLEELKKIPKKLNENKQIIITEIDKNNKLKNFFVADNWSDEAIENIKRMIDDAELKNLDLDQQIKQISSEIEVYKSKVSSTLEKLAPQFNYPPYGKTGIINK